MNATENTPQSVTTSNENKLTLVISSIFIPPFVIIYNIYDTTDIAPNYTNLIINVKFFYNIIIYNKHIYIIPHH